MNIIKYGAGIGIIFNNGNSLKDYHEQDCCEENYV